jgi:hypothetical protein
MPASSSCNAISIGLVKPPSTPTSMGAPMEICKALAPTIRAFSNLVIFGGPTVTFCSDA